MESTKFNEREFYRLSRKYLDFSKSLHPIKIMNNPALHGTLIELHHANTETMISICHIFRLTHINDVLSLSRAMFESIVNMGLLLSNKIPNGVERFDGYKFYDSYKLMSHLRDEEIYPGFVDLTYGPEKILELTEGKDRFVKKYGPSDSWCGMNMLQRVRLLDKYYSPTGSMNRFIEFLYCYIYRIGSSSIHGSASSFYLTRELVRKSDRENHVVSIQPIIHTLLFAGFHALYNYLLSIRFWGSMIEDKKEAIESYYQNELKGFS